MVVKLSVVSDLMRNKIQTCLTHSGHIYSGLYTDLNLSTLYLWVHINSIPRRAGVVIVYNGLIQRRCCPHN